MSSLISRFWNNFKTQPDMWFFFGFLLTFTLSIRKVMLYFPIQGTFNEYSGVFIYLSDVFLILTLVFWFISILCNDFIILSRYRLWISSAFHKLPPHQNYKYNLYKIKIYLKNSLKMRAKRIFNFWWRGMYIFLPLFLVFLSFLSILWSQNLSIALFRSFKLLEFYLLYLYIIFRFVSKLFHARLPKNCSAPICDNNVPRPPAGEAGGTSINEKQGSTSNCSTWNNFGRVEQFWAGGTIWLFFNIIIILGLFQAIIGIIQFFLQKSIDLFWLRESLISPEILGVAKVILNGEKYIRAYGLMTHPNVLGGFLLFSIVITLLYKKMFHMKHQLPPSPLQGDGQGVRLSDVPRGTISEKKISSISNCSTWNNWIFRLILAIQILALILTFSKSAIIGLIIALICLSVPARQKNVPCGTLSKEEFYPNSNCSTWNNSKIHLTQSLSLLRRKWLKMFHVEHLKLIILSVLIILVSIFFIIKPNLNSLFFNSLNERLFYLNVPYGTFESDLVLGIGAGQSVLMMQKFYSQTLEFWQYQPIHNVFLLIFSELGLIGLGLFIWWLWKLFHMEQFENSPHPNLLLIKEKELAPLSFIRRGAGGEVKIVPHGTIENNDYILHNNNIYLSSIIFSRYFQRILLGLIFIMLFDHYIWDIQQGSLLFWLTAGFVAGISRK